MTGEITLRGLVLPVSLNVRVLVPRFLDQLTARAQLFTPLSRVGPSSSSGFFPEQRLVINPTDFRAMEKLSENSVENSAKIQWKNSAKIQWKN